MALLELKNVTMRFGGVVATDNLSMEVNKGELVSLIGPNGAGKTTVFNVLTGVYPQAEGEIFFDGQQILGKSVQDIVHRGIARTFQNLRIFKTMRVIENVMMGDSRNIKENIFDILFRTKHFKEQERITAQKALDILSTLELEGIRDEYAGSLPYGQQRKVEIARAIATGAKLILLDEPAAGLNATETEELMRFIRSLLDKGFTVLMIEHDMSMVMNISDRIYVLNFGKLIATGTPEEIANNPDVIEAYLGGGDDDDE